MVKRRTVESSPNAWEAIQEEFGRRSDVRSGRMFSGSDLRVNGKIFALRGRSGFVVKLPRSRVDELIARRAGSRFAPGPRHVMKEWILIDLPETHWRDLAEEAYEYVKGLNA